MKKVIVYVEGPSDRLAMSEVFLSFIDREKIKGSVSIFFLIGEL